ncbi:MAG TPA: hypothetical protein VGQ44_07420 [Gemmatimonadaceae bacterium]|nr:hypothetical protein [Gemmatimonadaceae bacterium]
MPRKTRKAFAWGNGVLIALFSSALPIHTQNANAQDSRSLYASMAPIEQYRMDRDAEIALARTAAPPSISRDAEILVLGQKNFETAVRGKNGFVCVVGRAFAGPLNNPEFWSPKNRSPICMNPPAARSLLPYAMKQAGMALAGASKAQITEAIRTAVATKELGAPDAGSMCYMMSKQAYLTDQGSHNLAHVMFELPRSDVFQDDPAFFVSWDPAPVIEFNVPVGQWSDGTSAHAPHKPSTR